MQALDTLTNLLTDLNITYSHDSLVSLHPSNRVPTINPIITASLTPELKLTFRQFTYNQALLTLENVTNPFLKAAKEITGTSNRKLLPLLQTTIDELQGELSA